MDGGYKVAAELLSSIMAEPQKGLKRVRLLQLTSMGCFWIVIAGRSQ